MIKKTLSEIASYLDGEVDEKFQDIVINGVATDTRAIASGNLFLPLKGENTDGHRYVMDAFAGGAVASLWDRDHENPPSDVPLIFVDDALVALQDLAKAYLKSLSVVTIGITGSNGKTTTKDITAALLSQTFSVHKTQGNFNSHIGLPLTILATPANCEVLILEMGMNQRGEIEFLSKLAEPHIAAITNIGESHLQDLGSREAIADAKCEIVSGLIDDGILFYHGDEVLLRERLNTISNKQSFGMSVKNDFYPEEIKFERDGTAFTISERELFLPVLGEHNVLNAIVAIGIALEFNMTWEAIADGLRQVKLTNMRSEFVAGANGETLLNDAYNASPTSMRAALKLTAALSGFQRKFVVLGDMLELGEDEVNFHREIGELLDVEKFYQVYTYGELGKHIAEGARKHFPESRVLHFNDKEQLVQQLKVVTQKNDLVLVKASRGMRLEEVINALI